MHTQFNLTEKITEAILFYVSQNFPKQIVIVILMNRQLVIKSIFDISILKLHNKCNNLNEYIRKINSPENAGF